jgi:hypothetical protein
MFNADAMYGQLSLLDRKFFHCVDYEKFNDMSKAEDKDLRKFIMIDKRSKKVWKEMRTKIESKPHNTTLDELLTTWFQFTGSLEAIIDRQSTTANVAARALDAQTRVVNKRNHLKNVDDEGNVSSHEVYLTFYGHQLQARLDLIHDLC